MPKAKSKNTLTLELEVNASFLLMVPKPSQSGFDKDRKRGELCINAQIQHEGIISFMEIYPDHFSEGGLKVGSFDGDMCQIGLTGKVLREIDVKFFEDLVNALKESGSLPLLLSDISDSANSFYKDGDESTFGEVVIGTARLV